MNSDDLSYSPSFFAPERRTRRFYGMAVMRCSGVRPGGSVDLTLACSAVGWDALHNLSDLEGAGAWPDPVHDVTQFSIGDLGLFKEVKVGGET